MRNKTLSKEYFDWLYSQIGKQPRTYFKLCRLLDEIPFIWSVPNDDNRAEEGVRLRDLYIEEMGLNYEHTEVIYFLKRPCSVFELMVALCQRIDEQRMRLGDSDTRYAQWFHELLMNLRLAHYTDSATPYERFIEMDEQKIFRTVEIMMDRTYDFDGKGGLFPLKNRPRKDQRTVELWYQMQLYLAENYT